MGRPYNPNKVGDRELRQARRNMLETLAIQAEPPRPARACKNCKTAGALWHGCCSDACFIAWSDKLDAQWRRRTGQA